MPATLQAHLNTQSCDGLGTCDVPGQGLYRGGAQARMAWHVRVVVEGAAYLERLLQLRRECLRHTEGEAVPARMNKGID